MRGCVVLASNLAPLKPAARDKSLMSGGKLVTRADATAAGSSRSRAIRTPARSIEFVRAITANVAPSMHKPVAALLLSSTPLEGQLTALGCVLD